MLTELLLLPPFLTLHRICQLQRTREKMVLSVDSRLRGIMAAASFWWELKFPREKKATHKNKNLGDCTVN